MDIIYHRNCLDGCYSAYLLYLFSRFINQSLLQQFIKSILSIKQRSLEGIDIVTQKPIVEGFQPSQNFFHEQAQVGFHTYSVYAGQFHLSYNPKKFPLVIVVDSTCDNFSNVQKLSQKYQLVIIIDHHTTFKEVKSSINQLQNVYYLFQQGKCAAKLTLQFLNKVINFNKLLSTSYFEKLQYAIQCVWKNDTKINQDKLSKTFILGFYYFELQLSHQNPFLFKRIGCINLEYLLSKGSNLYLSHFTKIKNQITKAQMVELKYTNKLFLMLNPKQPAILSDIGTVLSYLSASNGLANVALLVIPNGKEIRGSCRSYKKFNNPLSLQIAQKFGGGGHIEAAGFKTNKNHFNNYIKVIGKPKINLQVTIQELQNIIFNNSGSQ